VKKIADLEAQVDTLGEQISEASDKLKAKDGQIYNLAVGNKFGQSQWVRENLIDAFANSPAILEKVFGSHFRFEDGEVRAYGGDGKPLLHVDSESNRARPATFDEALDQLIGPSFRKTSGAKGSDAPADGPPVRSTVSNKGDLRTQEAKAKYIKEHGLSAFQELPPAKRDEVVAL
jgi:hypothetical protein